jgi:oligopeptide transport system permease protein
MIVLLLRRTLWIALTLWAVFTVTFFLMRAVPGGPFDERREPPAAVLAAIEARYQLDRPLGEQYLHHLGGYLRGDLGPSYRLVDYSVAEVIGQGLPRSLTLGAIALGLALLIGIGAGAAAATSPGSRLDSAVMAIATLGLAVPNFVVAGLLVILAAFVIEILPAAGWGTPRHIVLPAICLSLPYAAAVARLARTGLLEAMTEDYIRTARAKGLSRSAALWRHALRPGMVPVVSYLGPAAAGILTGSLVIEQIFAIPGLGHHFVQAALNRDYPLSMGVVMLYTALVASFNLLVDLTVGALDPRAGGVE